MPEPLLNTATKDRKTADGEKMSPLALATLLIAVVWLRIRKNREGGTA